MSIDLISIPLHFIENVHLVGAAYKHLKMNQLQMYGSTVGQWHTIMALTSVSPATTMEPGS